MGPDDAVYLSIGDKNSVPGARDPMMHCGCVIRVNKDGSIPAGNLPASIKPPACWARGVRNGWSASWNDVWGEPTFLLANVGSNSVGGSAVYEELHTVSAGQHLGWPDCEGNSTLASIGGDSGGDCNISIHTDPILIYSHRDPHWAGTVATKWMYSSSVMGGFVYTGNEYPAEYRNTYFFADFNRGWIKRMEFQPGSTAVKAVHDFHSSAHAITTFAADNDGNLWYTTCASSRFGGIKSVKHPPKTAPTISIAEADVIIGPEPLSVIFTGAASPGEQADPSQTIELVWQFGDEALTTASGSTVTHTFTARGTYRVYLIATSDTNETATSEAVVITVGTPPTLTITSPGPETQIAFGDTVILMAHSNNQEDDAGGDICWQVDFIHNEHTHPVADGLCGASGVAQSFVIASDGHGYGEITGYRFRAVTESDELTTTRSVDTFISKPECTSYQDANYNGNIVEAFRCASPQVCGFRCTMRSDCDAYVFHPTFGGGCKLKTSATPEDPEQGLADSSDGVSTAGICNGDPFIVEHIFDDTDDTDLPGTHAEIAAWGQSHRPMPAALGELAAGLIGELVVAVGTGIGEGHTQTFAFNLTDHSWQVLAERPHQGFCHLAAVIDDELYLVGGFGGSSARALQVYDPAMDRWRTGPSYPGMGAGSFSGGLLGSELYVCGGLYYWHEADGDQPRFLPRYNFLPDDCHRYSPSQNRWLRVPNMLVPVHHAGSGSNGNKLYIFGGRTTDTDAAGPAVATVQVYDPATLSWTLGTPMPSGRSGMGATPFIAGRFWILGGEATTESGSERRSPEVATFDPATDTFASAERLPTAVHGIWPVADPARNRIYVVGGKMKPISI